MIVARGGENPDCAGSRGLLAEWDRRPPILAVIGRSVIFVIVVGASRLVLRMIDRAATTGLMPPQMSAVSTPVFAAFGADRLNAWIAQPPYI